MGAKKKGKKKKGPKEEPEPNDDYTNLTGAELENWVANYKNEL